MDIPNIGDLMSPSFPVGAFDVSASPTKWYCLMSLLHFACVLLVYFVLIVV